MQAIAPGKPTGLAASASGRHADRPFLDRAVGRRLRHHRLQDRGLDGRQCALDRPRSRYRQHRHALFAYRAFARLHAALPGFGDQRRGHVGGLQHRFRHHHHDRPAHAQQCAKLMRCRRHPRYWSFSDEVLDTNTSSAPGRGYRCLRCHRPTDVSVDRRPSLGGWWGRFTNAGAAPQLSSPVILPRSGSSPLPTTRPDLRRRRRRHRRTAAGNDARLLHRLRGHQQFQSSATDLHTEPRRPLVRDADGRDRDLGGIYVLRLWRRSWLGLTLPSYFHAQRQHNPR